MTVATGLAVASCGPGVATPIPEPPTLNLDRVGPSGKEVEPESSGRHLYGGLGAAPIGAVVRVTNLDQQEPPSVASVKSDGSFDLTVNVLTGQELRFDWARGSERGAPQDVHFIDDPQTFHLEPSARFACVKLTPGFAVDFAATVGQSLLIEAACPAGISLETPHTRLGLPDFALQTALPITVAPNESAALELAFGRTQAGAREDTLFFDIVSEGNTIRYPITLLAPASP